MSNSPPIDWSSQHYIGLLMVYAAHADLRYSDTERVIIIATVGETIALEIEKYFDSKSDFEVLAFLVKNREIYLPGPTGREHALELLMTLFQADGEFTRLEFSSFQFLEKMFYAGSSGLH